MSVISIFVFLVFSRVLQLLCFIYYTCHNYTLVDAVHCSTLYNNLMSTYDLSITTSKLVSRNTVHIILFQQLMIVRRCYISLCIEMWSHYTKILNIYLLSFVPRMGMCLMYSLCMHTNGHMWHSWDILLLNSYPCALLFH